MSEKTDTNNCLSLCVMRPAHVWVNGNPITLRNTEVYSPNL